MLPIFISLIGGILLSGVWFGLSIVMETFSARFFPRLGRIGQSVLTVVVPAVIPTVVILVLSRRTMFHVSSIADWRGWITILLTVFLVCLIIRNRPVKRIENGKALLADGIDGVFMEIPQRLMMQTFLWYLLEQLEAENSGYLAILLTAIVWCIGIVIQGVISKNTGRGIVVELAASFVFSIGVGYALFHTELIAFTMVAHFLERIAGYRIRVFRQKRRGVR